LTYEVYHSEKDEHHAFEGWYYKGGSLPQGPFGNKATASRMARKAKEHDEWFLSRGREKALNVSQMQGY
jgi:hypothetical protein